MAAPTRPRSTRRGRSRPQSITVDADLDFALELPGQRTVEGRLSGSGTALRLEVSDPLAFAGRSDARSVRGVAAAMAAQGLSVTVSTPRGPLITLGALRAPWWQRWVTGSRHIRIERGAGLLPLARGRARATAGALPSSALRPPSTVWPPAPTLMRRPREKSTTHAPRGAGDPRLIMAPRQPMQPADTSRVFPLTNERTVIGSGPDCDIRLPGLEARHAEVSHDERDEFVLVRLAAPGSVRVNGAPVETAVLRTASRLQVGDWTLSFYREEYADHGRPYGGRIGGELGRQRPQAPRPTTGSPDWSTDPRGDAL